ncbi:MAG: DUF4867 family protein [Lachnospiraceae bacterium]|nr:DUF4867 family protein [Lachnospiraceae bacterium]
MTIHSVTDASFSAYGKVLSGYDFDALLKKMAHTPLPMDRAIYVASDEELEALPVSKELSLRGYGGLPIEIGYCNGNNRKLNAIEYHRSSEIDIAVNDLVLLLGRQQDIREDYTYDTANMEAYLLPAGTAVELYATTLHYAPCSAGHEEGFRCVIVLPKDTNAQLTRSADAAGEDRLIAAKNKWLIAHPEAGIEGAFCGLQGENITV